MKVSVFTPTHRPDHLYQAYTSLCDQTFKDWEWVIVPNGASNGSAPVIIPDEIRADPRVHIVPPPKWFGGNGIVGALKRFACTQCKRDILVELDHDDFLTPVALERVVEAVDEGAGFVYSDFSNFRVDGSCEIYDKAYGWETYAARYGRDNYVAHRAFEANPSSLHLIFYAPNHIRAWTREAYDRAGGHDASLNVTDDHDLVCRTYLAGVEFKCIHECLYFYRLHADGQNTYVQRNAEIQIKQQDVSNKYIYRLVDEWCRRENLPKYDLGGAIGKPEGYLSIDTHDADVVCDVQEGLPFADNSVGCIRAFDFLEHIKDSVKLMNEIHRVLVPGGWLFSATPSTDGRGAFQDPTHVSFWNPNSFWYYTRAQQQKYVPAIKARFQAARIWQTFPTDWHKLHEIPYVYADLVALKGQKQPGLVEV